MKKLPFILALGGLLLLTGCSGQSSGESAALPTESAMSEQTIERPVPEITTAATLAETTTAASATETTASLTTTAATGAAEPLITTLSAATTEQLGGQGGEENAETPDPRYFNYIISPDAISMRLAGGNYQTLRWDFTEHLEKYPEGKYTLDDIDFDGHPDLFIPVRGLDTPNVQYAVYRWTDDMRLFEDTPTLYCNPVCHPDSKEVFTLQQMKNETDGTETISIIEAYAWRASLNKYALKKFREYRADFAALTLTASVLEDGVSEVTHYDTKEALEKAMLELYLPK